MDCECSRNHLKNTFEVFFIVLTVFSPAGILFPSIVPVSNRARNKFKKWEPAFLCDGIIPGTGALG